MRKWSIFLTFAFLPWSGSWPSKDAWQRDSKKDLGWEFVGGRNRGSTDGWCESTILSRTEERLE